MLDIKSELLAIEKQREQDFISIIELLDFLKSNNQNVSYSEIATFLLLKLEPHDVRKTNDELWGNEAFDMWEEQHGIKIFEIPEKITDKPRKINGYLFFNALEEIINNFTAFNLYYSNPEVIDLLKTEEYRTIFIDRNQIEHILNIKTLDEKELNEKYKNEQKIALAMALTKTDEFVKNTDINKSPVGLAERLVMQQQIAELQSRIEELEAENQNLKKPEPQSSEPPKQERIQAHHRALFALLVKKHFTGFDTRNSLFNAINLELKANGFTTKNIKPDTFYKMIDDDFPMTGEIFPPKKT